MLNEQTDNVYIFELSKKEMRLASVYGNLFIHVFTTVVSLTLFTLFHRLFKHLPYYGTPLLFLLLIPLSFNFLHSLHIFAKQSFFKRTFKITSEYIQVKRCNLPDVKCLWTDFVRFGVEDTKLPINQSRLSHTQARYILFTDGTRILITPMGRGVLRLYTPLLELCLEYSDRSNHST